MVMMKWTCSGACSRKATFRSFLKVNAPPSAASFPARILNRVVFPVPFLAMMAALSPLDKPSVMPSKSTCSPNDFDRFLAVINDMVDSIPFEVSLMNWINFRAIGL